mgnify:FL=1
MSLGPKRVRREQEKCDKREKLLYVRKGTRLIDVEIIAWRERYNSLNGSYNHLKQHNMWRAQSKTISLQSIT